MAVVEPAVESVSDPRHVLPSQPAGARPFPSSLTRSGGLRPRGSPSAFVRGHPRSRELRRDLAVALAKAGSPSLAGPRNPRSAPAGAPVARPQYCVRAVGYTAAMRVDVSAE